jgi:hypothetical protein
VLGISIDELPSFSVLPKSPEYLILVLPSLSRIDPRFPVHNEGGMMAAESVTSLTSSSVSSFVAHGSSSIDVLVLKLGDESAATFVRWLRRHFLDRRDSMGSSVSIPSHIPSHSAINSSSDEASVDTRERASSVALPSRNLSNTSASSSENQLFTNLVPRSRSKSQTAATMEMLPRRPLSCATVVLTASNGTLSADATSQSGPESPVQSPQQKIRASNSSPSTSPLKMAVRMRSEPLNRIDSVDVDAEEEEKAPTAPLRQLKKRSSIDSIQSTSTVVHHEALPTDDVVPAATAAPTPVPAESCPFSDVHDRAKEFVEGNRTVATIFAALLLLVQVPFFLRVTLSSVPLDTSTEPSYSDLYNVLFPVWGSSTMTTLPRFVAGILSSALSRLFLPGTFIGDHPVLVSMAAFVFSISIFSTMSSLSAVKQFQKWIVCRRRYVIGIVLVCIAPFMLHETIFYLSHPVFAHFRGLKSVLPMLLMLLAYLSFMTAVVCIIYSLAFLIKIDKRVYMAFYVSLAHSTCSLTFLKLSDEVYHHPTGRHFPLAFGRFFLLFLIPQVLGFLCCRRCPCALVLFWRCGVLFFVALFLNDQILALPAIAQRIKIRTTQLGAYLLIFLMIKPSSVVC